MIILSAQLKILQKNLFLLQNKAAELLLIEIIVNPDKFQAAVVKKNCRMKDAYALNIQDQTINSENRIKMPEIKIDNTLSFDQNIFNLYQKSNNQMRQEEFRSTWALRKKKCSEKFSSDLILIPVLLCGFSVLQNMSTQNTI